MKLLGDFTPRFEIYLDIAGKYRWRFLKNDEIVARSPGSYQTDAECRKDICASKYWVSNAPIRVLHKPLLKDKN